MSDDAAGSGHAFFSLASAITSYMDDSYELAAFDPTIDGLVAALERSGEIVLLVTGEAAATEWTAANGSAYIRIDLLRREDASEDHSELWIITRGIVEHHSAR